jgi:hypothetical protein
MARGKLPIATAVGRKLNDLTAGAKIHWRHCSRYRTQLRRPRQIGTQATNVAKSKASHASCLCPPIHPILFFPENKQLSSTFDFAC